MEHTAASVTFENAHNKISLHIMKFGYALFVIVSVTCYVGNMSAMRQVDNPQASIRSVGDCAKVREGGGGGRSKGEEQPFFSFLNSPSTVVLG